MHILRPFVCAAACLALALTGCAGSSAPAGWLQDPADAGRTATGGWIEVHYPGDDMAPAVVMGEFLGFREDELCVLTGAGVTTIPVTRVEHARLRGYAPMQTGLALYTVVGSLSTASHGFFLLASLPTWIICGSIATASQSRQGLIEYRPEGRAIGDLAMYARFPAGVPDGLDLSSLRPRPPLGYRRP